MACLEEMFKSIWDTEFFRKINSDSHVVISKIDNSSSPGLSDERNKVFIPTIYMSLSPPMSCSESCGPEKPLLILVGTQPLPEAGWTWVCRFHTMWCAQSIPMNSELMTWSVVCVPETDWVGLKRFQIVWYLPTERRSLLHSFYLGWSSWLFDDRK